MALTESTMVNLGSKAPYFNLPNIDGKDLSIENFTNEVLVVIFTCNHCPYAMAVEDRIIELANNYSSNVDFVLISSNDADNYPADSPEKMAEQAKSKIIPFHIYLMKHKILQNHTTQFALLIFSFITQIES